MFFYCECLKPWGVLQMEPVSSSLAGGWRLWQLPVASPRPVGVCRLAISVGTGSRGWVVLAYRFEPSSVTEVFLRKNQS